MTQITAICSTLATSMPGAYQNPCSLRLAVPFPPPAPCHLERSASSSPSPIISMWRNDSSPARPRSNFASSVKLSLFQPLQLKISLSHNTVLCTPPKALVILSLITCVHVLRMELSSTTQKHGLQHQTDLGANPSSTAYSSRDLEQVI